MKVEGRGGGYWWTREQWVERWLVDWFNRNAAGGCKRAADGTFSNTELVVQAFNLKELARDLAVAVPNADHLRGAKWALKRKVKRKAKRVKV